MTDNTDNTDNNEMDCSSSRRKFLSVAASGAAGVAALATTGISSSFAAGMPKKEGGKPAGKAGGPPTRPKFEHKQPFSVLTIGTGSPKIDAERASSCTVIQSKGKYYVLDTGNNSATSFVSNGLALKDISSFLYTHLHMDHTADLFDFMTNRWMEGAKDLTIYGPPRVGQLYEFLTFFYKDDLNYRKIRGMARGVNDQGMFTGVKVKELIGENHFKLDGMKVSTAELTHTMYNLGYRFDIDGKSIVVSGDTSFDEDLITLAKGADVLVMDTTFVTDFKSDGDTDSGAFTDASIEKPEPAFLHAGNFNVDPHPTLPEIMKIARESKVKKLVFTHFPPFPFKEEEMRQLIADGNYGYKGEMIFSYDGLEINP